MKVLQINTVCGIGSTGRICTDIADVLEQNGHICKIAYGREPVPEKYRKYAVRIGNDFDKYLHALQTRIFDNTGFNSKYVTKKFIEWVEGYNPDIIHLHNLHGYYINVEILFDYLSKIDKPVVWTLHDCWSFTGHCAYYSYVKCDKWKTGCYDCSQKRGYPSSVLLDNSKSNWLYKKSTFTKVRRMMLVTPSQWLASELNQSFLQQYPVRVIPNGIDFNTFKPTPCDFKEKNGLVGKKIILGVASVWEDRKGLNDFIELSKIINDDYKIVLVGLSEKQKNKIPGNLLAIARTNNVKELAELYSVSDILFNPTYEDNFPTVNIEAIACGLPVVTYKSGGSPEIVEKTGWGKVVEKKDYAAVIEYLDEITQKKLQNRPVMQNQMINNYMNLYLRMIGR